VIRLQIVAEGQAEERFCKRMLIPHLGHFQVFANVSMIETSTRHRRPDIHFKGGFVTYEHLRKDTVNFLRGDSADDFRVTTFVDFFHMPSDVPGYATMPAGETDAKIRHLEAALADDIGDTRFLPYIQKHEFEAFLFVDMDRLVELYPGHAAKVDRIKRAAAGVAPEDVNGGDNTSPSNRILAVFPEHERNKPRAVDVLEGIGLERIRNACPHFDAWVRQMEGLNGGMRRLVH
jgi:hypothetical protein